MSKRLKNTGKRTLSVFLSATTTLWLAGASALAPIAAVADHTNAHTIEQLTASIADLQAKLNALIGTSAGGATGCPASGSFAVNLKMGQTSNNVRDLQTFLKAQGSDIYPSGLVTSYFGGLTKAAVMKFQDKYASSILTPLGLKAGSGYWGASSRAKANELCSAVAVTPPATPPPPGTPPPPAAMGTGLTVAAGKHPDARLAPQSASNLAFTTVVFTASSDGDVVVKSLTAERTGLAQDAAYSAIVLLDENMNRIGLDKTLNSNHQVVLNEPFTVKKGESRTMYLGANMAASLASYAGQVGYIALVAVGTDAQVNGTLPITGSGHTINATLTLGSISFTRGNRDPGAGATKDVGTKDFIYSSLKATAGSAEEVVWKSIKWNQSGSVAKTDLENVKICVDGGDCYDATVSADGKYFSANLGTEGLTLAKGGNKEVYIKGDVLSGTNRTIDFDLYKYTDAQFDGKTYKYGITPTATNGTNCSGTTSCDDGEFQSVEPRFDAYQFTVGAGSVSVSKDADTASGNIAAGSSKQLMGAFVFDVKGEPVTFTSWAISLTTTNGSANASKKEPTNLTVYNASGTAIAGPKDVKAKVVTLTDSVTLPVGKNVLTVKADINEFWQKDDTIQLSFTPSTAVSSVTGQTTGNSVTPTPSTSISGQTITVQAGSLTIDAATSLAAQNIIAGSTGAELGRFVFNANASGEDIRITSGTIQQSVTGSSGQLYSQLQLCDQGSKTVCYNTGSNKVDPASGGARELTFTFDNNVVVPKGTSKVYSLYGNVSSTATSGATVIFDYSSNVTNADYAVTGVKSGASITETVNTTAGATMTVQVGGGWTVVLDSSAPSEKWVPAGGTGVTLNVLRFTSTTEAFTLTNMRLQLDETGSSTGANYSNVYLYDEDGTLLISKASPQFTNFVEDFDLRTGTKDFVIPKDGNRRMTIKADLAGIGNNLSGAAGEILGIGFDATTRTQNSAKGVSSGSVVYTGTGAGNDRPENADSSLAQVATFRSVPTIARLELTTTKLVSGPQTLAKFSVTADPAYDVALAKVTFSIATSGVTAFTTSLPQFRLYNVTDGKYVSNATGSLAAYFDTMGALSPNYDSSNRLIVRTYADNTTDYTDAAGQGTNGQQTYGGWITISKGLTHVFELRATGSITTDGTGDSIVATLLGDDARAGYLRLTGASRIRMAAKNRIDTEEVNATVAKANVATRTNFIWSDFASDATTSHSAHTADWMNGFRVPGLPTTGLSSWTVAN